MLDALALWSAPRADLAAYLARALLFAEHLLFAVGEHLGSVGADLRRETCPAETKAHASQVASMRSIEL